MRSTVVWDAPPRWTRQALVRLLGKKLKGRVRKAWLFGSHAAGRATAASDVDLILVNPTALPWPERGRPFGDLRESFGAMDIVVYTPEEWRELSRHPTAFLREARRNWVGIPLGGIRLARPATTSSAREPARPE